MRETVCLQDTLAGIEPRPLKPLRFGALVLLALVASACASTPAPQLYWYKAGASQQEFFRDDYQCRRETSATGYQTYTTPPNIFYPGGVTTTTPSTQVNADLYARCMASRGYSLGPATTPVEQPSRPSPQPTSGSPKSTVPQCEWGMYWNSASGQCVKIGE